MPSKEEVPLKEKNEKPRKKTLKEKIAYIKANITIEPVLITYVVPGVLARLATQNLNLDKACRVNLKYGDKVCDALIAKEGTSYQKEELAVQELIASMEAWKNFILTAIPSLLILFIGAWSDRTGNRKICILLPIFGDLLMCLSNILNAYFFYELPVEVTMFLEAFLPAITGGWITTYMGAFSYIGEMSSEETRTFRVGVANLCLTAGTPIGTALSGILLKHIGYYGVFTTSSVLFCFSICHGYFFIKDPERPITDKKQDQAGFCGFLKSFFDIKHAKDTLTVAIKPGPNRRRLKSTLVLSSIAFIYGPAYVTYVVPGVLARLATQNLNLDKACRVNLKYGDKVCDALIAKEGTSYQLEELAVQELIAPMEAWKNFILTAIPSLLILFIGSWSDRTGKRKICILLPIVGELLMCISNILNVYYFYEIPVQVTMFLEAIFPAVTGSWTSIYMGVFSYLSEISSEETRTFRVGIGNLCLTAGRPIGTALSGILLKETGYYGVFTISSLLFCCSIFHCYFYIKDPERPKSDEKKDAIGICGFLKSFFDIKHVKDTLTVAFKSGPNQRRIKSVLLLSCLAFVHTPIVGEYTVRYLFTRYRFNWDALKYSFYNTFYICIHALGALISISIFSRKWKWGDATLGLISSCSKIVGGLATGLARNSLEMYIAVAIEMFNATSFTALRSISSKLASTDELGKMTSVFNLTEVLTSMVFGPMYSWIYMMSLKIDSGIIYYCSTVLTVPPILIFVWFYIQNRKEIQEKSTKSDLDGNEKSKNDELKVKEDCLVNSIDLNDGLYFVE